MPISEALIQKNLAAAALTQLNKVAVFPRAAVTNYEAGNFQRDDRVKVRRPKRRQATNLNPRVTPLTLTEGEFFSGDVVLDRLWADGFKTYGSDPTQSLEMYIREVGSQMADGIATPNDTYLYSKFRTHAATTGTVELGMNAPIQIVASVNSTGDFTDYGAATHRAAATVLDGINGFEIPPDNRFAILSTAAKGAFLGDTTLIDGFASALNLASGNLIQTGMPNGQFVDRYGLQTAGSSSVTGQTAKNMLAAAVGGTAVTAAVSASAAAVSGSDPLFTYADESTGSSFRNAGAVQITLTATATTLLSSGGPAVGDIVRLTGSSLPTFFAVILRIIDGATTAPKLVIVPFNAKGVRQSAAAITTSYVVSIPDIPSVNVAYHQEMLLIANRAIREPSPGSGALATTLRSEQTNQVIQIFRGQYDLTTVSEGQAYYMLTGAALSDVRKGVLMLSL